MEYRQLGRNGPQVPAIALGAWPFGGAMGAVGEEVAVATVRSAIDRGITMVDTAQSYRASERIVGRALAGGYRERCFLATKVSGDFSPRAIRAAIENSLRQLAVDHVDLYQIHGWNPEYPVEASMEAMERLRQEGKTRYIGVSNYNAAQMALAMETAPFQSVQPGYNMLDRGIEAEDIPFCVEHGIGILAYSPLGQGLLTGRYRPGHRFAADDYRSERAHFQGEQFARTVAIADRLAELAADKGLSLVQLAIAWILRLPAISTVLVGAKNPGQLDDHLGAVGVRFSGDELEAIDAVLASAA
ncbi:MAG: aldo/keto reductase [Gemmatimonadetes bacterium]|nr:aldo/keto reductase [Gemmatimonadota bacterium]